MVPRSLPRLRIAIACNADWSAMVGNDRARFCGHCCQTVYNVANLRPREVAALFEQHGDRLPCLRLYRRPDGTVVTRGCLDWVWAGARRVRMGVVSVAAMAVGFWSSVFFWRGLLHPTAPSTVPAVVPAKPTAPAPRAAHPIPPERPHMMGVPEPPREWRERWERRRARFPEVTEAAVNAAVVPALRQLRDLDFRHSGRVEIRVTIRPNGRVSSVHLDAAADLLTPAARKRIEGVVRVVSFPRSGEEYQAEFPLILAR